MSRKDLEPVENINWANLLLSKTRLNPYLSAVAHDPAGALELYKVNLKTSARLFIWLAFLEVILRNALVGALTARHSDSALDPFVSIWPDLAPEERAVFRKAEHGSRLKGNHGNFETLISELPFSFWKHLLSSRHQTTLWAGSLRHAFPYLKPQRRALVFEAVQHAVELRNRIAHHEPIFRRELGTDLRQIQKIIGWISPEALAWAKANLPSLGSVH